MFRAAGWVLASVTLLAWSLEGGGQESAGGDPLPAGVVARLGTLRFRHGHFITSIAFAPDGKTLATTDANRILYLWDAATGQEVRRFVGQTGGYAGAPAVFSPDGKVLAAGDGQKNLILWDVATGQELHRHPGKGWTTWQAWSPDGRALALADYAGPLVLIEPQTGKVIRSFVGHSKRVERVAFSPDGKLLASGSLDGTARLWDVATGKPLRELVGHKYTVEAVAFSADGQRLATGGGPADSCIILWDTHSGALLRRIEGDGQTRGFTSLAFSPDGALLASAASDQTNRLWNVASGQPVRQFNPRLVVRSGYSACGRVAFSPDGSILAGRGPHDTVLCLWDVASGRPVHDFAAHASAVQAVAISPDSRRIATGGRDGSLLLWELASGRLLRRLDGHHGPVARLLFSPDGKTLASLGADQICLWDATTGRIRHGISSGSDRSIAFSPDGRTLAAGNESGAVTFWDTASGRPLRQLQVHPVRLNPDNERYVAPVTALAYSPDGQRLATGLDSDWEQREEVFHVYDLATGQVVHRIQGPLPERDNCRHQSPQLAFSPDGRLLLTGHGYKLVRVWELVSGRERRRAGANNISGPNNWPYTAAYSPDGRRIATWGHQNAVVRLWDAASGRELAALRGHRGVVHAAAFAPDGRHLVSAGEDTTALVWDIAHFQPTPPSAADLSPTQLADCWNELAGTDAIRAGRAIDTLSSAPTAAVAWLADRLQPAPAVNRDGLQRLIADLDSDHFELREKAMAELEKQLPLAEDLLRQALADPSPEVRRRAATLLEKLSARAVAPEELRLARAIEVLERIGTPAARRLLEKLAAGGPGARPTTDARAALQRLTIADR